ncbi:U-box domain-containing protein 70 [Iris pallida]|uniref:RING-type E3 ubiquitin transferase n=1 Tax=Iris pallida TaxID=29817 RepID=A0AAX6EWV0_IRIPA|nr:U-box domain-containing protein 70 [Iris pallida]
MSTFRFDDVLTAHPTKLNIPFDLNKENYSCSIQLTNNTDRIVAYTLWASRRGLLVSPGADRYVATIVPRSTCSLTVTVNGLTTEAAPDGTQWICIWAYVVKDGVKAEDITWHNLYNLTKEIRRRGFCKLPVVCNYDTVPTANSSSAVPEENEKGSLLHDHNNNNPLQPSNNKQMKRIENSPPPAELMLPTTGGYGSISRKRSEEDTGGYPSFKAFSRKEIQYATNNFSKSLMIGGGGYGKVYKCQLDNWDVVVKILDDQGHQGDQEYIREMEVLEGMRHKNLIHLMGTCFKLRALVYEYLPNGSLEDCLRDRPRELTWKIRTRIVYEICTALRFIHTRSPPLIHGDLKPHNVLLDANFKVKLADFGFGRYLSEGENSKAFRHTHNISGSVGYMDPDYLGSGKVTMGVDVYSFGKTVVKILTGRHPPDIFTEVHEAKKRGSFMTVVDPTVGDWPEDVVLILAHFALRSTKSDRYRSEFMAKFHSALGKI